MGTRLAATVGAVGFEGGDDAGEGAQSDHRGGGEEEDGVEGEDVDDDADLGAEDGDFPAAFVHRIVNAGHDGCTSNEGDQRGHQGEDLIEPAHFVEELGHDAADRPGEGEAIFLFVIS